MGGEKAIFNEETGPTFVEYGVVFVEFGDFFVEFESLTKTWYAKKSPHYAMPAFVEYGDSFVEFGDFFVEFGEKSEEKPILNESIQSL